MSGRRAVAFPSHKDSMGDFLNPDNTYRGTLVKRGIQPKDHIRDNVKDLRMKELRLKQEKDDRELADNRSKQLYKLPQFQNVESRLHDERRRYADEDDYENMPNSARRNDDVSNRMRRLSLDNEGDEPKFLTRGQSEKRRNELAEKKKLIREELEIKMEEERMLAEKPSTPRKASVPRAFEVNPVAEPSNTNFISRNKVNAIAMAAKKKSDDRQDDGRHEEFGKVPKYLEDRKARWAEEEEERRRRMPDPNCPPGMCLMSEEERRETLETLEQSREEALHQLRKLPFVIETPMMRKKQEYLEGKLREIDRALGIFSKPKVYVALDR